MQIANIPRYLFQPDNKVQFWHDFHGWEGVPSDRPFYWSKQISRGSVALIARGYGMEDAYGNGAILVTMLDLPEPENTP